jgi:hypothetical protein
MTIQTNIAWGVAANKVRKLQKQWDEWYPRRQQNPHMGRTPEQDEAERICEILAPKLVAAKAQLAAIESSL